MAKFSIASKKRLETCDTRLQEICAEAIKEYDFIVLCGHRNKADQDEAYQKGNSKLKWPKSKHNANPSRAMDLSPYPLDWKNLQRFKDLSKVILRIAGEKNIKIRWGGDFNMDGNQTTNDAWDLPHYELVL